MVTRHRRPRPRGYLQRMKAEGVERATSCCAATPDECDAPHGCTACGGQCPKPLVKRYSTITLDPPWPYEDRINAKNRGAANHYDLMTIDELKALAGPLSLVSAQNSHLYLWTTNSFLEEACILMRTWGWVLKTARTWVKPQIGMGRYYRNNTEHVLFGVRGRLPGQVRNLPTAFTAPRSRHSAKPEVFYADVERMSPGPYLEVFGRQERAGWTVLGNEVDGQRVDVALRRLAA